MGHRLVVLDRSDSAIDHSSSTPFKEIQPVSRRLLPRSGAGTNLFQTNFLALYADVEIEIDFFDPNRMRFVVA